MKATLLISCFNNKNDLKLLLPSIERLNTGRHALEVIIRDDASTDGTADWLDQHFKWIKLIRGKQNLGFVRSNNEAFKHATGDVIVLLNADTLPCADFLTAGLSVLETFPDVAGVNSNMIMPWVMSLNDFLKSRPEALPAWEYQLTPYGFCRYVTVLHQIRTTNFMTGGGCFLRRSALNAGGDLFDDTLGKGSYCEDTDLSLRLLKRGMRIVYAPKAVIYHNQAPKKAFRGHALTKLLNITWNRFYVMAKHHAPIEFARNYPLYLAGIVKKMDHIGLAGPKLLFAQVTGVAIAILFLTLFPFWCCMASIFSLERKR